MDRIEKLFDEKQITVEAYLSLRQEFQERQERERQREHEERRRQREHEERRRQREHEERQREHEERQREHEERKRQWQREHEERERQRQQELEERERQRQQEHEERQLERQERERQWQLELQEMQNRMQQDEAKRRRELEMMDRKHAIQVIKADLGQISMTEDELFNDAVDQRRVTSFSFPPKWQTKCKERRNRSQVAPGEARPLNPDELKAALAEYAKKASTVKREAELQELFMELTEKFLVGFPDRQLVDTSSNTFLRGRKPDAALKESVQRLTSISVQAVVELKRGTLDEATLETLPTSTGARESKPFSNNHLGQAMNWCLLMLESQTWRTSARCLLGDASHFGLMEVRSPASSSSPAKVFLLNPHLKVTDPDAIYLIDEFLLGTEFVPCQVPTSFINLQGTSRTTYWDYDEMAVLATSPKMIVYLGEVSNVTGSASDLNQSAVVKILKDQVAYEREKANLIELSQRCPEQSLLNGYNDDQRALLMDYRGESLSMRKSIWSRHTLVQLVDKLEQLHKVGILHRDIRPANIVLSENGTPYFIDFGLSVTMDANEEFKGVYVGTIAYSPQSHLDAEYDTMELVFNRSTDLQSLVKSWAFSLFSESAQVGIQPRYGGSLKDRKRQAHNRWNALCEWIPPIGKAYRCASNKDYEGLREVFKSSPAAPGT